MTFLHTDVEVQNKDNRLRHPRTDTQWNGSHKGSDTLWSNAPPIQPYILQAQHSWCLFQQRTIGQGYSILFSTPTVSMTYSLSKSPFPYRSLHLGNILVDNTGCCIDLHQGILQYPQCYFIYKHWLKTYSALEAVYQSLCHFFHTTCKQTLICN